jgi:hypothetical protein
MVGCPSCSPLLWINVLPPCVTNELTDLLNMLVETGTVVEYRFGFATSNSVCIGLPVAMHLHVRSLTCFVDQHPAHNLYL